MQPVWVLLWKHCLMRKRRYIRTFCDYLSVLLYLLLIYLVVNITNNDRHEDIHYTEEFIFGEPLEPGQQASILYTPETMFTNQLMDQVGANLNLRRLDHLPRGKEKGYFGFSNGTALSMLEYSKDLGPRDAIIVFKGSDLDFPPATLNYTIRMKDDFVTSQYEPEENTDMGSHEYFGTQYEPFMRLQWTIDTSYLHMMTGEKVTQRLTLQEFPYTSQNYKPALMEACMLSAALMPLALTFAFVFLTGRLFEEKNSGIHELIKMTGVSWEELSLSYVLDMVPSLLIHVVCGAVFFKQIGVMPHTASGFLAVAMTLHFLTVIALAFVVIYVFNMSQYLELVTMALYSALWVVSLLSQKVNGRAMSLLLGLLPHDPLMKFWKILGTREIFGEGITLSNMWYYDSSSPGTAVETYLLMVLQIVLFSMLAWYLSRVRPGTYGQALPWKFPFSKDYWCMKPKVEVAPEETQLASEADQRYFEKAPAGLPVGIQITDVYKSFGKEIVLHGVSLRVYKGEITVLLGQNGAGKTTLISIITGLMSATSGRVLVEGMDSLQQAKKVRKLIGLCPQHNIFFPHLTVLEHVMFFAMLKGQSYGASRSSGSALLARLRLGGAHAVAAPPALSGGGRRRAALACAVAGGARVLLLDEPTSGLDVETRRDLWDLLLSLREEHTVLLTTHLMEEADALGDRVAALHHGVLRCHATAMFLKRAIGTGYRLSFTTIGEPKETAITSALTRVVPDATVRDQRPGAISYNLPAKDTSKFPQLFAMLEERRSELGIDTIGVGKSTLDEVFVELCSDVSATLTEESEPSVTEPAHEKVTGARLLARQFAALLWRQWYYITSRMFASLFILPFMMLLIWLFTEMANNHPFGSHSSELTERNGAVPMDLELYSARPERRALVNIDADALAALRAAHPRVHFQEVADVAEAVLQIGKKHITEYNKYLVGIELNDTHAKALYTTTVRHAAPAALHLLSDALTARRAPAVRVAAHNHPLRGAYVPYAETTLRLPKGQQQITQWASSVAMILFVYLCSLSALPGAERASGARLAHAQAGSARGVLWAATLAAQLAQALAAAALPVLLFASVVERDHTIDRPGFIAVLFMLLLLGIIAFLGLVNLVSTLAGQSTTSFVLPVIAFVFSRITPRIPSSDRLYDKLLQLANIVMPPHTLALALAKATQMAKLNAFCDLNRDKCPLLAGPEPFRSDTCCNSAPGSDPWSYWAMNDDGAGKSMLILAWQALMYLVNSAPGSDPWSYWAMNDDGAGKSMLILAWQALMYLILMYLSDDGVFARLLARAWRPAAPAPRFGDAVTRAEAAYVEKAIQLPKQQVTDAILCHKLQKCYGGFLNRKPFFVVNGISFSVKKGECFGLLGVNGAGKSTTFKMLAGEVCPTGGDVFANGHHLADRTKYMRTLSYCPQFAGADEFLTGRQNLTLLLTLSGLQAADVAAVSNSWIREVGLERHADKCVSSYSGGCARRLAAAAALCARAPAALLDEPTAGVDPVARRRMHQALVRARATRSLVIASHSLDEIEALCHRIAILSGGELRALGSAAALKAQFAAGYSVVFKLSSAQDVPDSVSALDEFKDALHQHFDCSLQNQHQTMLSYHIKDKLRYSELFTAVEGLKQQFPGLLEDYTVTETTLEEVFLAFAREAREPAVPTSGV